MSKVKGYRKIVLFWAVIAFLVGCSEYRVSDDPTLRLAFSTDTLCFDTVFTAQGSATAQMKVYNRNASALLIDRAWLKNGNAYHVNIDGEPDASKWRDIQINGGDSMYLFIRVEIDPTDQNTPVLVTGLCNVQTIRTCDMANLEVVIFVRGKRPTEDMVELADENDMILICTPYSMFKTCGILYGAGMKPLY